MRMHPPPSLARSCRIWTRLSVPAIPAPGAVWPTTGPKGHPSSWLVHPLNAHHHLPSPSGTPCMRAVGRIMVLCVSHRYLPFLALSTSQSLQVRNPFSTSSKIWQLLVILYIFGKGLMRRLQRHLNCRKRFSIVVEIP